MRSDPYRFAIINLTGGGLSGGYRKYLKTLMPLLQKDPRVAELSVFLPPEVDGTDLSDEAVFETWSGRDQLSGFHRLRTTIGRGGFDGVFIPTARWLNCGDVPVICMVRNMEPLTVPFEGNSATERCRNVLRYWAARRASKRAQRVIAVSNYVKDFLLERWRLDARRVAVVYHGSQPVRDCPENIELNSSHGARSVIFTAGSIRPARGLQDLIEALAELRKRNVRPDLIVAGACDSEGYLRHLKRQAEQGGVAEQVRWAGRVGPAEMSRFYKESDIFVMTSRAEACPNIALEAMSYGCLCISTDCPPMPEFFGRAALYYKSRSGQQLADVLGSALARPREAFFEQREQARRRAAEFTWENCASRTVDELIAAIEQKDYDRN